MGRLIQAFRTTGTRTLATLPNIEFARLALLSISTIVACANPQLCASQQVTKATPPALPQAPEPQQEALPRAVPVSAGDEGEPLTTEADTQEQHGDLLRLSGNVVVTFRGRTLHADLITYDKATGNLALDGNIVITGGVNDESLHAARGTYNLFAETGRFYDVTGSVGMSNLGKQRTYESTNPLLFAGKMVVKTGPVNYDIYDGKVTSCLLPNPDWVLTAGHFSLDGDKARAYKSTFHLLHVPILFLPYVTHPTDTEQRQSGFTTPYFNYSGTKGFVFGEEAYITLGRSADLTVGSQIYSARGYEESGTFRYKGIGNDFATAHFTALQDRGYIAPNKIFTNQGGEDITVSFRRKLTPKTRVVGDAEYLSSYIYRQAFNDNFNQAVSSDINSILYAVNQQHGYSSALRFDRYQGLKRVQLQSIDPASGLVTTTPEQQVRIFHVPSLDFTAVDHPIAHTPLLWSLESSAAGLKRTQPNFTSSGIIQRFDLRPELSLPLAGGGWHTLSSVAVRETVYSRSRATPYPPNTPPVELTEPVNRSSLEFQTDIRPPVLERTFTNPAFLARFFGAQVRHTIEPQIVYRRVTGIDNFLSILRFDDVDIASNTNVLQYGVTQRLFGTRKTATSGPCSSNSSSDLSSRTGPAPLAGAMERPAPASAANSGDDEDRSQESASGLDANGIPIPESAPQARGHNNAGPACKPSAAPSQAEWVSWTLTQQHFFDPSFGNAVIPGRRNIFDTTLMFSGIAFLTEARDISPLLSKIRVRTSTHTDFEWDFDLDTGAKRFTRSNVFIDAHEGAVFGAISYASLNAPGRRYNFTIDANGNESQTPSAVSTFSQLRALLGYGNELKPGFSIAGTANIDTDAGSLQYGALQSGYNWNCCGVSVEFRKYELGSTRNEPTARFSFTLVNIGTAGNLRKSQRLF